MKPQTALRHTGVAHDENPPGRGSGRYGYGTGKSPYQRAKAGDFVNRVQMLRQAGVSDEVIADEMVISERDLHKRMSSESGHLNTDSKPPVTRRDTSSAHEFVSKVQNYKKNKVPEKQIAKELDMSMRELRAKYHNATVDIRRADYEFVNALKEKGYGASDIAREFTKIDPDGKVWRESSIRSLADPQKAANKDKTDVAAEILRKQVAKKGFVDVGKGTEYDLDVSEEGKKNALARLEDEGYVKKKIQVEQLGTGHKTTVTVLAGPGTTYADIYKNLDKISPVNDMRDDSRTASMGIKVKSIDSSRVMVRYAEEGGVDKDGVIELKQGVPELSLGKARYAQVRIGVDGTHYLKGMAMYADDTSDWPKGVDIVFNTNKHVGTPMIGDKDNEVLKRMKITKSGEVNEDNPFGASIKPEEKLKMANRYYSDENGEKHLSPVNIVNEEGDWGNWSKTLSSQFLFKQSAPLVKRQLDIAYKTKLAEFEEIRNLTNPEVKQKLLLSFADDCDSSSVHLKAARLPGQVTKVLLPFPDLAETQCYCPDRHDGDQVVLIRYPHAGWFEIPKLTVNNSLPSANRTIPNARDAIGVHPKSLAQMSGADSDGDTAICIPINGYTKVRTEKAIDDLVTFDTKKYKLPPDAPKMKSSTKQNEMGKITNLIDDMTAQSAPIEEIVRAVKHSMVVIDAEKHHLDYKQSFKDHNIQELKDKWQKGPDGRHGAGTVVTRAKSRYDVPLRKAWNPSQIDPKTGEKIYKETGETYTDKKGKVHIRTERSTKMAEVKDARELLSEHPNPKEIYYADFANQMKDLANKARLEYLSTTPSKTNSSAAKLYSEEVKSLNVKLVQALKNAPRERQAQIVANQFVKQQIADNPEMEAEDVKKLKGTALTNARLRCHAKKEQVVITDKEWEAIQAHAVSSTKVRAILDNTDMDAVKKRSMPKNYKHGIPPQKLSLARDLYEKSRSKNNGEKVYDLAEIADMIGVSVSTLTKALNE